jgi:hypothetical protein
LAVRLRMRPHGRTGRGGTLFWGHNEDLSMHDKVWRSGKCPETNDRGFNTSSCRLKLTDDERRSRLGVKVMEDRCGVCSRYVAAKEASSDSRVQISIRTSFDKVKMLNVE